MEFGRGDFESGECEFEHTVTPELVDSFCIRPGAIVTLHQGYPSYVIECEAGNIAMDEQIASSTCV
jgi:hypothetical protein